MKNGQKLQDNNTRNEKAEKQLSNINLFFSAFGNFLNGFFCITQYFLTGNLLFGYITLGIITIILIATYGLSYSNACIKNERLWDYISICADRLGPLNPIFLLLGIIFAINANAKTIGLWIAMELLQLSCYVFAFRRSFPDFGVTFSRKIWTWIKNSNALIVTVLIANVFGWLWYIAPENNRYADLWLNLFAGFIASSITISVIDQIIKRQKEMNERPLRQAMYRDVQLFTSRFISLWKEMYLRSVEVRTNMTIEKFFSPSSIEIIRDSLDLSCMANVNPEQTWFSYIENTRKDLEERGQKILITYSNIAEPEVLQSIHYLMNDSVYLGRLNLIAQIHMHDMQEHIPRPTLLRNYTLQPQNMDSIMVSQLFEWCHKQYKKLHETSPNIRVTVLPIPKQLDFLTYNTTITSAMNEEKLNKMVSDFEIWKQSKENCSDE